MKTKSASATTKLKFFKTTALNNAIMQTQMTAFDLVISILQMSYEDCAHLLDVFRNENYNAHTPFVSIYEQEDESTWSDSVLHKTIEPNFFACDIEELLQIVDEIWTPVEFAQVA